MTDLLEALQTHLLMTKTSQTKIYNHLRKCKQGSTIPMLEKHRQRRFWHLTSVEISPAHHYELENLQIADMWRSPGD